MGNDPTRVYISTETCYRVANNTRPYEWPNIINRPVHSCCFNKGGSTIDSTTLQSAYDTFYYRQSGRSLICGSVTKNCPGVVKGYHEKKIVIKRSLWFEIQTWFSWVRRKCAAHLATRLCEQIYRAFYSKVKYFKLYDNETTSMSFSVWQELYVKGLVYCSASYLRLLELHSGENCFEIHVTF